MSDPKFTLVSIDMGYGHLRPAYALAQVLDCEVLHVDRPPLARDRDQALWSYVRQYYESLSRASQWPLLGWPLRTLLDRTTDIRDLYAERDQSRPSAGVRLLDGLIKKGMGATLVDHLSRFDATLVTTFFMPAIAADRLGYDKIYCIVTDSDIHRVWAPVDPINTRINYLVPTQRTRRRLRAYGVPEERIHVTGFPLPHQLVGGPDLAELRSYLPARLVRLDPSGSFRNDLKHAISHFLGPLPELRGDDTIPMLTFAVGGAGAQVGLAAEFLPSLRGLLADGRLKLTLVAGIKKAVAEQLEQRVAEAGLRRQLGPGRPIQLLYNPSFERYLEEFNGTLRRSDALWTKPSEMTFFAGLGLPLILSDPVGTHEQYNRRWVREEGAGMKQREPRFAGEWLKDWLKDGTLASAAWSGFTRLPSYGLYQILEAIGARDALGKIAPAAQRATSAGAPN